MRADIVVITAASLIGSTIDALLALKRPGQIVVIAGFSGSCDPRWYEGLGINYAAGIDLDRCDDPQSLDLNNIFSYPGYFEKIG